VAEGDISAAHILISEDVRKAKRLVERFDASEMRGCVLYDDKGQIIAITQRISDWKEKSRDGLKNILESRKAHGEIVEFKKYSVFSYIHPVLDDESGILGWSRYLPTSRGSPGLPKYEITALHWAFFFC